MADRLQSPVRIGRLSGTHPGQTPIEGPIRVCNVLARPLLADAQLIAGVKGVGRVVRWVHILDIADVRSFIRGGEFVLTTAAIVGHSEEKFIRYVQQLIEGGASALCVELGTVVQEIPQYICNLADGHAFPIIVFPFEVRFVDITQDLHKLIILQERQRLSEEEWVEHVIRGEAEDAGMSFATGVRMRADRRYRVVVFQFSESFEDNAENPLRLSRSDLTHFVRESFQRSRLRAYLSGRSDRIIAIVELDGSSTQWQPRLEAASSCLHTALQRLGLPEADDFLMGLGSEITAPASGRDSYREAVEARAFAKAYGRRVLCYEDAGVYRWMAPMVRSGEAAGLAIQNLAPVIEYDRQGHAQLLETLKVYLDCDRSKQQTADRLFIHRQTLYHRLEQLERLLCVNLDDPVQRLGIHLTVYAYLYQQQRRDGGRRLSST